MPACENCGGTDIDFDPSRGDAVCIQCGTVLEENTIVNEVTFAQDAGGGSSVVGQFVAAQPGAGSASLGFSKESREVAYSNGQRHISQLAAALRLNDQHQEAAQRLFMLAVQHNFIQGRRTQNVIAACLYTVCRREKTPHMLIDFSDVLQTNVYMLGSCFLKFTRLLSLTLPIIDPSLYIHRFASKLELGDKTHQVSISALKLVQRMRRDWIQTGRRPSGICGAALLIAARVHGFRRTQREIVRIVRICDVTLRKRLTEFSETAIGSLTARELDSVDLESFESADPPSFTRNRLADQQRISMRALTPEEFAIQQRAAELATLRVSQLRDRLLSLGQSAQGPKPELLKRLLVHNATTAAAAAAAAAAGADAVDAAGAQQGGEGSVLALRDNGNGAGADADDAQAAGEEAVVEAEMTRAMQSQTIRALAARRVARATGGGGDSDAPFVETVAEGEDDEGMEDDADDAELGGVEAGPMTLPDPEEHLPWWNTAWGSADLLASRAEREGGGEEEQQLLMDELNEDMEALDGAVDCYVIRDEAEVQLKTRVWEEMNKEYTEAQKAKEEARAAAEAAGLDPQSRPRKPRKNKRKGDPSDEAADAAEAAGGELRRRNLSSRINYDIVNVLSQTLAEDAQLMPTGSGGPVELPLGPGAFANVAPQADALSNSGFSEGFDDDHASIGAGSGGDPEY